MEVSEDNTVVQENPEMSVEKECKAGKYQAGGFKGVNESWLRPVSYTHLTLPTMAVV